MLALLHQMKDFFTGKPAKRRSSRWRKVRAEHLKRQPACVVCGHKKRLEVHHKHPFHLRPDLELEPSNLITLGESCPTGNHHLLYGHLGSWKSFNVHVDTDANHWREKITNRP